VTCHKSEEGLDKIKTILDQEPTTTSTVPPEQDQEQWPRRKASLSTYPEATTKGKAKTNIKAD
jgi:hypothetical protein